MLALAAGLFVVAAFAGSSIPRNAAWRDAPHGVTILLETNGTPTGIPCLRTRMKDWSATFPEVTTMREGQGDEPGGRRALRS